MKSPERDAEGIMRCEHGHKVADGCEFCDLEAIRTNTEELAFIGKLLLALVVVLLCLSSAFQVLNY